MTTDRCDLITVVDEYADFIEKLTDKLLALKTHHFIAQKQSEFLN